MEGAYSPLLQEEGIHFAGTIGKPHANSTFGLQQLTVECMEDNFEVNLGAAFDPLDQQKMEWFGG